MADPPDKKTIEIAREILTKSEFSVWLAKHVAGHGRRSGSLALGISEEAWRYRLNQATRKMLLAARGEA